MLKVGFESLSPQRSRPEVLEGQPKGEVRPEVPEALNGPKGSPRGSPLRFYMGSHRVHKEVQLSGCSDPPDGPPTAFRLYVENGISTRDVLVKLGTWPDYVFQPNYALMPLGELREFLHLNKHLPGIPSAAELEAKQGFEVGDMQTRLLKVVEDQALYILQLEAQQQRFEARLQALEAMGK